MWCVTGSRGTETDDGYKCCMGAASNPAQGQQPTERIKREKQVTNEKDERD